METTIRQLAERCGVSKTTITNYINEQGLRDRLTMKNHAYQVPEDIADAIHEHFIPTEAPQSEPQTNRKEVCDEVGGMVGDLLAEKDARIADLQKQLEEKDKQINNLLEINKANAIIIAKYTALPETTQEEEQKEEPPSKPAESVEEPEPRKWWQFWK